MLREEKLGARIAGQKDLDARLAQAIMKDGKFEVINYTSVFCSDSPWLKPSLKDNLEYINENAEKLGRQKMRSDALKRQFAFHGKYD